MTTLTNTETLEAVAERVVDENLDTYHYSTSRRDLIAATLSALRNERERCAKLADEFARRLRTVGPHSVAAGVEVLASEIRSGKDGDKDA